MSTSQDYIDRTVDFLAYPGAEEIGDILLTQELVLPGEGGQICTGIQKLAQRFLLELLTERGSMIYLPARGTDFMTQARLGQLRTQLDVFAAFSAALVDIRNQLTAEETDDDPLDERYESAEILSVIAGPGFANIRVRVTSRAGTSRKVILPIQTTGV